MAVKRKSNWYIYFIAFGIALAFVIGIIMTFSWYLFPETKETSGGLTSTGELADDFRPDSSHNFTIITTLSDRAQDTPELFIIVSYNAVDNSLVFIPVPNGISIPSGERSLSNIFASKGGEGVAEAVSNATGVSFDGYISFDRQSFIRLTSAYGNVRYNVPETILVTDGSELDAFNVGEQIFTPEAIFRYIYLADFGQGESYRFNVISELLSELINQNLRYTDSSLLDSYFNIIKEACGTNLTDEMFIKRKAALLNTITYGSNPAEYYIPYGEYGGDGSFVIAENSIISIRQKCSQDE